MNTFFRLTASLSVLTAVALLIGCTPQETPNQPQASVNEGHENRAAHTKTTPAERSPNRQQTSDPKAPRYSVRAPQLGATDGQAAQNQTLNQKADEIAEVVSRIPGVERSAVLLTGKVALVGVDLQKDISGSKIDTIKYSVKEAAERTGKGYNAIVTADVDTVTRVRDLIAGMRAGKPVSTLSDEIADIVSRLIPEM
jgi:YhcN/YlaJ family sporulation lipoprotein